MRLIPVLFRVLVFSTSVIFAPLVSNLLAIISIPDDLAYLFSNRLSVGLAQYKNLPRLDLRDVQKMILIILLILIQKWDKKAIAVLT